MLNKRVYKDGKPVELQEKIRVGLDLSKEERNLLKLVGRGNMSEGIRTTINFYVSKNNIKFKDL